MIPALVTELAVETSERPALFQQLWKARGASVGASMSGATSASTRAVFNIDAHELWYSMVELTGLMYSGATGLDGTPSPVFNLTQWQTVFMADPEVTPTMHATVTARMLEWIDEIRNLLDPPKQAPLKDVECPNCGLSRVTTGEGELATEGPAIWWMLRAGEDLTAACRNPACFDLDGHPSKWVGDVAVIHLGRRSGQDIDVDLIRDSRAPVAEVSYDDGGKTIITPEDPEYLAVVTEMRAGS